MSTATQRKAWNEAMRSAGAVLPPSATVSGGATSSSRSGGVASRAADRRRKRRNNARKSLDGSAAGGSGGGVSSLEEKEYKVALHMDMLEGVTDNTTLDGDDDEEYDEFAELDDYDDDDDEHGGKGKKGKKNKRKRKRASGSGANKKKASAVPKYLKARSLASILIEEASRTDSVAKQYVDASVRRLGSGKTVTARAQKVDCSSNKHDMSVTSTTYTNPYPSRKFCPVTGLYGEYTEPKTGIPYATLSALEQIRERVPPWMNVGNNNSGNASYWEAVKSLQNNND